jgi:hypothetical protein
MAPRVSTSSNDSLGFAAPLKSKAADRALESRTGNSAVARIRMAIVTANAWWESAESSYVLDDGLARLIEPDYRGVLRVRAGRIPRQAA